VDVRGCPGGLSNSWKRPPGHPGPVEMASRKRQRYALTAKGRAPIALTSASRSEQAALPLIQPAQPGQRRNHLRRELLQPRSRHGRLLRSHPPMAARPVARYQSQTNQAPRAPRCINECLDGASRAGARTRQLRRPCSTRPCRSPGQYGLPLGRRLSTRPQVRVLPGALCDVAGHRHGPDRRLVGPV
jgi:hypothetical protein